MSSKIIPLGLDQIGRKFLAPEKEIIGKWLVRVYSF
jgi:hypothetical protein